VEQVVSGLIVEELGPSEQPKLYTGVPSRVAYLAHPLGRGPDREQNRQNAMTWLAWLTEAFSDVAFVADWILLAGLWPETPARRVRGLKIDLALLSRCDEIWLVGGRVTEGMRIELTHAMERGLKVVDMTYLGSLPPCELA
jgi:hypothetical protein